MFLGFIKNTILLKEVAILSIIVETIKGNWEKLRIGLGLGSRKKMTYPIKL